MDLNLFIYAGLTTLVILVLCRGLAQLRLAALAGALMQTVLSVLLIFEFISEKNAGNKSQMLFTSSYQWFETLHINYQTGVDGISVAMIALTALVVLAGILVSWNEERLSKEFFILLTVLAMGAYGFFISTDLFTMFFFLEVAVIPKFLLIAIWGSGKKEYSAMKLALMLMLGSALVFVGLAGIYFHMSDISGVPGFSFSDISAQHLSPEMQRVFFPFLFIGFGIFTAIFPFHTWVPDGHSSAPTAASMFLAGISMKLGGYGCLRVAVSLMPEGAIIYSDHIIILSTIAIIYGAFATMMQTDLKYINAYSSVSHCGFVLLGIGMLTKTAITGAVMQMVSHGLMTALFFAAIGMMYERTHTRDVAKLGGLLKVMPFISTVFIIAGLCSLGLPGFSGFVAEMTIFVGSWENPDAMYKVATILACASIVVTAVYILRAAGKSVMGPLSDSQHMNLTDAAWYERSASFLLVTAIVFMGVAPIYFYRLLDPESSWIMNRIVGF
jgi:NADH-quinone oxidoreductase subunit M